MKDKASQPSAPQKTRINQSSKSSFSNQPSTPSVSRRNSCSTIKISRGFLYLLMGLEIGLVAIGEVFHDKWLVHYAAQGLIFWIRKFTPPVQIPVREQDKKVVRHKRSRRRRKK